MADKKTKKQEYKELDLQQLLDTLVRKLWLIVVVSVLCAVIAFMVTYYFITPLYQSSAMFYVNNSALSVGDTSFSISAGDISASKELVDSYIVILKSRDTLNEVVDYSGLNITAGELRGMISASSVNSTEIFRVTITSDDPAEARALADAVSYILPKKIAGIIEGTSAKVVETPVIPMSPSSPSYPKNTILGFLIGMIASVGYVVVKLLLDITIRNEDNIRSVTDYPILASVPNMAAPGKGKYYASDRKSNTSGGPSVVTDSKQNLMGQDMGFAASEAYKLLRTKLQFSFTDDQTSHVIGMSSAMEGEGKSLTSVNLAYSLSQLNKRVILLDCDMRRPTLADKLGIRKSPGLSSCLTGQSGLQELIQTCGIPGAEQSFHVIAAGQNPPNPVELLSSSRMEQILQALKGAYDYVVLDLPPVGEVSDALAVANMVDGMLLVVRQDYCTTPELSSCIDQFEFIKSKILGLVFNCTTDGRTGYGYKKYYKYGRSSAYSRKYEGAYANTRVKRGRFLNETGGESSMEQGND